MQSSPQAAVWTEPCHFPAFSLRQLRSRRYVTGRKLGEGGMGEVHLVRDRLTGRVLARKQIRSDRRKDRHSSDRFKSERALIARLRHPNTVRLLGQGTRVDGTPYYLMEYLPGLDLEKIVKRTGPLRPERVIYLMQQIAAALGEVHQLGFVHRDIKPANLVISNIQGHGDVAKLIDFGLATSISTESREGFQPEAEFVGSPLYTSPEAALGSDSPDQRSDIYSLGATMYELLTGHPPFHSENPLRVIFAHAQEEPTPPSELGIDLPAGLELVVMKCLEKSPSDRFENVTALIDAFEAVELKQTWSEVDARHWWRNLRAASEPVVSNSPSETATRLLRTQ